MKIRSKLYLILTTFFCGTIPAVSLPAADDCPTPVGLHEKIESQPAAGMFLIARRDMPDPRFRKTVILLAAHDDGGSLGLIINRASAAKLSSLVPEYKELDKQGHRIYFGGPVGIQQLKFLVRSNDPLDTAVHIMDDLYISGNHLTLEQMLSLDKSDNELRVYLGYAGWGPLQLDGELDRRDWHLRKADIEEVFTENTDYIWQRFIDVLEPKGQLVEFNKPEMNAHFKQPVTITSYDSVGNSAYF